MNRAHDLLIRRDDISVISLSEAAEPEIEEGETLLRVERFGLTANNVTYAVMDESFGYWTFFPAPAGWGRIPVWGYATVVKSRAPEIEIGERIFGSLPMSTFAVLRPHQVTPASFMDRTLGRRPISPLYNLYNRVSQDPSYDEAGEDARILFPFLTSFLVATMFTRAHWHDAQALIVTSASSKTAMGLAHMTRATAPTIRRIGLTSARNRSFVTSTGLYDVVLDYDSIRDIPVIPSVVADFAGSDTVLEEIHLSLGSQYRRAARIGMTHCTGRVAHGSNRSVPVPELFLSPVHASAMMEEMGAAAFGAAVAARMTPFLIEARQWVTVKEVVGLAEGGRVFVSLVNGTAPPEWATVVAVTGHARRGLTRPIRI